ncbi:hypothetical protein HOY80DRAFT_15904 [Tuber brumale]|nr:hypothetical protein HOY80DRAFT_15904 [Tuber brumale]
MITFPEPLRNRPAHLPTAEPRTNGKRLDRITILLSFPTLAEVKGDSASSKSVHRPFTEPTCQAPHICSLSGLVPSWCPARSPATYSGLQGLILVGMSSFSNKKCFCNEIFLIFLIFLFDVMLPGIILLRQL